MKVALFGFDKSKTGCVRNKTIYAKKVLAKAIKDSNNLQLDQKHPDFVISVGGDGTFLSAFHKYASSIHTVHFVGFDTGHLGFYTDWSGNQLSQFVDSLLHHASKHMVSYVLLQTTIHYVPKNLAHPTANDKDTFLSLNETSLKRADGSLLKADVYNNNSKHKFERFSGDGLCVCTPTGSTGYNEALGGSILCPDLQAIEMTPIAPVCSHTYPSLRNSMTISEGDKFTIYPQRDAQNLITVDGKPIKRMVASIKFTVSKHRIHFVKYHHIPFWDRVSQAFI